MRLDSSPFWQALVVQTFRPVPTWTDIKDHARSSYKLAEEHEHSFKVVFEYPGGRLQAVAGGPLGGGSGVDGHGSGLWQVILRWERPGKLPGPVCAATSQRRGADKWFTHELARV